MNSAVIAVAIGMVVFWTVLMVAAAFLDRRRGRQIERDLTEMERKYHLDGSDQFGSFDNRHH
jgi:hypothetical protein